MYIDLYTAMSEVNSFSASLDIVDYNYDYADGIF